MRRPPRGRADERLAGARRAGPAACPPVGAAAGMACMAGAAAGGATAPRCAGQTKEATPSENNPNAHTLRMARSREASSKPPITNRCLSVRGGFTERGRQARILHQRLAEEKRFFSSCCQYFQVMSAPGGAESVMWRAICGMMRW